MDNQRVLPHGFTSKDNRVRHFYSKIATGEIIVFIILMVFSINIELLLDQPYKIIMIWMFVFTFLGSSIFIYMFTWYYLNLDQNGLTLFFRFHYKRIEWTEIIQITVKMRHQKQKDSNILLGVGVVVYDPYIMQTGAVQLYIYTSKDCIKTPNQLLRFYAINRFLHYLVNLQKYSIQRIDSEANERGRIYYYINWEIKTSDSLSKQFSPNDQFNLYLRNNSGKELNQSLSRIYKLALAISFLGIVDLLFVMYIYLLREYDLFFIFVFLIGGLVIISISIIMSIRSPEARKIQEYQPIYHIF